MYLAPFGVIYPLNFMAFSQCHLNIMFNSAKSEGWQKDNIRITMLNANIVHFTLYQHSSYYIGAQAWNNMPIVLHEITTI